VSLSLVIVLDSVANISDYFLSFQDAIFLVFLGPSLVIADIFR